MRKHFFYYASPALSLEGAIDECWSRYRAFLDRFQDPHPLYCVFFTAEAQLDGYLFTKGLLASAFRDLHQFSCIAQAPYGSHLAMELSVLDNPRAEFRVERKFNNATPYTTIESDVEKEVYISGLCGCARDSIRVQSEAAFRQAERILDTEGMDFSNVYRQWNYIERITDFDRSSEGQKQHYQILNDVRSAYYARAVFENGYPAATGIGMETGGIVLDLIASRGKHIKQIPIVNPEQLDAHRYTQDVLVGDALKENGAKTTPKFERAKYVECAYNHSLYVSGTAAIKGENTIPSDDIREQTRITLDNISKLHYNDSEKWSYRHMRAYVKHPEDIPAVEEICRGYFGDIPMQYLKADVCRDNLIVEIEAEIDLI